MAEWNGEPAPPERLLVIAAHPDDAEFVLAGTVAKWIRAGTVVRYVLATSGDAGTHRLDVTREELTRIREAEQRAAARVLGVEEVVFLGYPDGMVQPSLDLRRDLVREIRRFSPDMAICFDPTRVFVRGSYINHPDHRAVGQAAIEALSPTAAMPLSFPEHLAEGLKPHRVRQILIASPVQPDTWVDISETLDIRVEALRQHRSQLDLERGDFVGMVRQWAIDAGAEVGLPYAESFMRIVRPASRGD
jgi:LmbE family N-acetylglucosaminyl deacetylase